MKKDILERIREEAQVFAQDYPQTDAFLYEYDGQSYCICPACQTITPADSQSIHACPVCEQPLLNKPSDREMDRIQGPVVPGEDALYITEMDFQKLTVRGYGWSTEDFALWYSNCNRACRHLDYSLLAVNLPLISDSVPGLLFAFELSMANLNLQLLKGTVRDKGELLEKLRKAKIISPALSAGVEFLERAGLESFSQLLDIGAGAALQKYRIKYQPDKLAEFLLKQLPDPSEYYDYGSDLFLMTGLDGWPVLAAGKIDSSGKTGKGYAYVDFYTTDGKAFHWNPAHSTFSPFKTDGQFPAADHPVSSICQQPDLDAVIALGSKLEEYGICTRQEWIKQAEELAMASALDEHAEEKSMGNFKGAVYNAARYLYRKEGWFRQLLEVSIHLALCCAAPDSQALLGRIRSGHRKLMPRALKAAKWMESVFSSRAGMENYDSNWINQIFRPVFRAFSAGIKPAEKDDVFLQNILDAAPRFETGSRGAVSPGCGISKLIRSYLGLPENLRQWAVRQCTQAENAFAFCLRLQDAVCFLYRQALKPSDWQPEDGRILPWSQPLSFDDGVPDFRHAPDRKKNSAVCLENDSFQIVPAEEKDFIAAAAVLGVPIFSASGQAFLEKSVQYEKDCGHSAFWIVQNGDRPVSLLCKDSDGLTIMEGTSLEISHDRPARVIPHPDLACTDLRYKDLLRRFALMVQPDQAWLKEPVFSSQMKDAANYELFVTTGWNISEILDEDEGRLVSALRACCRQLCGMQDTSQVFGTYLNQIIGTYLKWMADCGRLVQGPQETPLYSALFLTWLSYALTLFEGKRKNAQAGQLTLEELFPSDLSTAMMQAVNMNGVPFFLPL